MSPIWFTPFIIVAGALQALGAVMSAQLRVSLSNPWLALTVLFTLNAFFFAGLFAVLPRPLPTIDGISAMPWWAPWLGSPVRLRSSPASPSLTNSGPDRLMG